MKKSNKYVKTRGQRLALEQANSKHHAPSALNQVPIKPSSAFSSSAAAVPPIIKRPIGRPKKIKKITKEQTPKQKQKKVKETKQKIVRKYKKKSAQVPITNPPVKRKYTKSKFPKHKLKIKLQAETPQQNNLVQGLNKSKGKTFKINLSVNIPKQANSQEKNIKRQNALINQQTSPQKNIQALITKQNKSYKKAGKGSKSKITTANQDSPIQQNTSIKLQPEVPKRKKGRPRKIIQLNVGTKIEQRTMDQQKMLDAFVQNAIRIRKIKNERQFFESFSRIIEYMRDSWEYGQLSNSLKMLPRPQDVLKIGIQITRGIRKQLQVQAMSQVI